MSENVKILKVKLVKGGEKLELVLKESDKVKSKDNKECENPVHPDLSNAVQALAVHLAILTDFIEPKQSNDAEELEKFTVTGYSVKDKLGVEGVVITGMRRTKTGQKYSINSPFTRYDTDASDDEGYILMNDLLDKIDTIDSEVRKYLFDGKMLQPSLFDEGESKESEAVTQMQIANPKNEDDQNEEMLSRLRNTQGGNGSDLYANPEAMKRVAAMGNDEDPVGGAVNAMLQEQRDHLAGKGKRNGAKKRGGK